MTKETTDKSLYLEPEEYLYRVSVRQEILQKHGSWTDQALREFQDWILARNQMLKEAR